ncbi:MAG: septal ring lytic transglycosylase RlpA family protein [Acidobacteriaceae bacterium]|nr:septal ring lytic transglycosylase RlpA family protein [Acidobacteriaceae bacterium]
MTLMARTYLVYPVTVLVAVLTMTSAGCHKRVVTRAAPPPPPVTSTPHPASGSKTASSKPSPAVPAPLPPDIRRKPDLVETGLASWYGPPYSGRRGTDGSVYDENAMTAAHLTLPLGTMARVTNLATNQSAMVKITDRGPFVQGRILDLSKAAAIAIGTYSQGVAKVRIEAWFPAPRPGAMPGGKWCVQIGAFQHEKDALRLKNALVRRYAKARVMEFSGPTGYWVRIHPAVPSHQNAIAAAASIHVTGAVPFIVRLD